MRMIGFRLCILELSFGAGRRSRERHAAPGGWCPDLFDDPHGMDPTVDEAGSDGVAECQAGYL